MKASSYVSETVVDISRYKSPAVFDSLKKVRTVIEECWNKSGWFHTEIITLTKNGKKVGYGVYDKRRKQLLSLPTERSFEDDLQHSSQRV